MEEDDDDDDDDDDPECNSLTSTLNSRNISLLKQPLAANKHTNFPPFNETKNSLPYSQQPKTCPHLEPRNAVDKLPFFS